MADPQSNLTGRVVSWENNTRLISTAGTPLATFTFNMSGPSIPFLPHTSIGARSAVAGLGGWTAELNMLLKTPAIGNNALVTFATGYVLHANTTDVTITGDSLDVTEFAAANADPTWRSFIAGAYGWGGNWGGFLDDTTKLSAIGAASTGGAARFQYGVSGALPLILSGNILAETGNLALADGTPNTYAYSFLGDGVLAAPASGGETIIGDGTSAIVASAGRLVLSAGDGTKVSGTAFWTSINVRAAVGDMVVVSVTAQGSGDPNIS